MPDKGRFTSLSRLGGLGGWQQGGGAAPAKPWEPTQSIGGLLPTVWYDATQLTGLTDGTLISTVTDYSGNGYHATAVTTSRPTYKTNIQNGKPVMRFDGGDNPKTADNTTPLIDQPYTVMLAFRAAVGGSKEVPFDTQVQEGDYTSHCQLASNGNKTLNINCGTGRATGLNGNEGSGIKAATFMIWVAVINADSTFNLFDNRYMAFASPGTRSIRGISLGKDAVGNGSLTGDIGEVLVYPGALGLDDAKKLSAYAIAKWGVTPYSFYNFIGDSITYGYKTGGLNANSYPAQCMALMSNHYVYINRGITGQSVAQEITAAATQATAYYSSALAKNVLIEFGGSNDINNSPTPNATTIYNNIVAYCNDRKAEGYLVVRPTILPRNDFDATKETCRQTINASILGSSGVFSAVVDLTAVAALQTPTDETYFDVDHIHPNAAGNTAIASAIQAVLAAL